MLRKLWAQFRSSVRPDSPLTSDRLLRASIDSPMVLDRLWAEFIDTGNVAAVLRVVSVLDWEDRVRTRLQSWLSAIRPEMWTRAPFKDYQQLLIRCSFPINYDLRSIDGPVDLDVHVALLARHGDLKFADLPVALSSQELLSLSMKSASLWSLLAMAKQHQVVANVCDQEAKKSGGAARLLLGNVRAPRRG
jgi:hypothetical protein